MNEIPVPLPPLPEQHRIVEKIEALFSELDKGVEQLKTAQQQLKVYRQAVLKWAFEGKLTEEWRKQMSEARGQRSEVVDGQANNKSQTARDLLERIKQEREAQAKASGKKLKPVTPLSEKELAELPKLPEGWGWVKLRDVTDVSGGLTKNAKRNSLAIKRPYLRVANVYENRLNLTQVDFIGLRKEELTRVTLQTDDLLIVEGNGSKDQIGRVAIWNGLVKDCVHQNHIIKARGFSERVMAFLLYFLISRIGRNHIEKVASSTSGLFTLSISKVEQLSVPICCADEQMIVVQEIETRLSVCDKLEETITESLQQSEALRQSILKKAFEGKLVPQDPRDEPASVLLDRIRRRRVADREVRPEIKHAT